MKRFIKKVLLFALFCMIFMVAIPMAIDPYNVFHVNKIRDNGVEPNKNYIKMHYILDNPDRYDAFLFGSSRVGAIHTENIPDVNCYNMTYSEGLPAEHLDNIKTLIDNDIIPKKIFIGVDSLSYTLDPLEHQSQQSRCSFEFARENPLDFITLYMDPSMAFKSLETTKAYEPEENFVEKFYSYGWWCDYGETNQLTPETTYPSIGQSYHLEEVLDCIAETVAVCKDAGIELVIFTSPMYSITHEESLNRDYLYFLEQLASITDYYNFSGYNDITLNVDNFTDTSHYNAEIGDLMIDYMCDGTTDETLLAQGFGFYVTEANIDEFLDILRSQTFSQ